jgi:hypothetical protein
LLRLQAEAALSERHEIVRVRRIARKDGSAYEYKQEVQSPKKASRFEDALRSIEQFIAEDLPFPGQERPWYGNQHRHIRTDVPQDDRVV